MLEAKDFMLVGLGLGNGLLTVGMYWGIIKTRVNGHARDIALLQSDTVKKEPFGMLQEEFRLSRQENREDHREIKQALENLKLGGGV